MAFNVIIIKFVAFNDNNKQFHCSYCIYILIRTFIKRYIMKNGINTWEKRNNKEWFFQFCKYELNRIVRYFIRFKS